MSNTYTRGRRSKGTHDRRASMVYERLRKRSYRGSRTHEEHAAYVQGVRDGIESYRSSN